MQTNLKKRKNPLWRKALIVAFLPIMVFIWTTGWVLMQLGTPSENPKNKQKQQYTHPTFITHQNEQQTPNERDKISHENEIIA